jgi:hypothetical protein
LRCSGYWTLVPTARLAAETGADGEYKLGLTLRVQEKRGLRWSVMSTCIRYACITVQTGRCECGGKAIIRWRFAEIVSDPVFFSTAMMKRRPADG